MCHMNLLSKKTQSFFKKNKTQLSVKVLDLLQDFLKERIFVLHGFDAILRCAPIATLYVLSSNIIQTNFYN